MRPTLPKPFVAFYRRRARVGLGALLSLGIACEPTPPPVAPGPPIPAQPVVDLGAMDAECDAMIGALGQFKTCPNLELDDREDLDAWIARAQKDIEAGRKARPEDDNAQKAIALACRRATRSVIAATERCVAGPRPRDAWWGVRR